MNNAAKQQFTDLVKKANATTGLYFHCSSNELMARRNLWGRSGFNSGLIAELIPVEKIKSISNLEMRVTLKNDSIIQLITADKGVDQVRGTKPVAIIFSEIVPRNGPIHEYITQMSN